MRANRVISLIIVAGGVAVSGSATRADLPPDEQIVYHVRQVPSDPQSTVVFDIILSLSAQSSSDDSVGWRIDTIECRRADAGAVTVWVESNPTVDSPDGLWWIRHQDTASPRLREFAESPLLEGTAENQDPQGADLDYSIVGDTPPVQPLPYPNTAALTFSCKETGQAEPIEVGDDEPVEIDDDPAIEPL